MCIIHAPKKAVYSNTADEPCIGLFVVVAVQRNSCTCGRFCDTVQRSAFPLACEGNVAVFSSLIVLFIIVKCLPVCSDGSLCAFIYSSMSRIHLSIGHLTVLYRDAYISIYIYSH